MNDINAKKGEKNRERKRTNGERKLDILSTSDLTEWYSSDVRISSHFLTGMCVGACHFIQSAAKRLPSVYGVVAVVLISPPQTAQVNGFSWFDRAPLPPIPTHVPQYPFCGVCWRWLRICDWQQTTAEHTYHIHTQHGHHRLMYERVKSQENYFFRIG